MAVNEHGDNRPDAADERIARLYKEAAREEPPARLDRVIAEAARERSAGPASPPRTPWWLAWRVPFAFAAVAVVSVSLVALMVEEDRDRLTAVPPPAPVASAPESPREQPAVAAKADKAVREPPPERKATAAPARDEPSRDRARREPGELAAQAQKRSDDERRETSSTVETYSRAQKPAAIEAPASPAPASAPAADAVSAPAPAARRAAPKATVGIRGLEEQSASGAAARPSPDVARHLVELDKQPPAAWIERVLTLRKEGRAAEAEGVLAELKQRYPEVALPPELR